MDREMKFRAWDDEDEWLYSDTFGLSVFFDECSESMDTIEQFVNRKDKHGTEMYDGDIFTGMHDFGPGGFAERQGIVKFDSELGYRWQYWQLDTIEVIGNIHEPSSDNKTNG